MLHERYRKEGDTYCIDLQFHDFRQLYDSRDPAPFYERDLDEAFARYLWMSLDELPREHKVKICLIGPSYDENKQQYDLLIKAIHEYFGHEARKAQNDIRHLFRQGRRFLFFGGIFLAICVAIAFNVGESKSILGRAVYEGVLILGWVALWQPLNIFLYEWWPFLYRKRICKTLAAAEIEYRQLAPKDFPAKAPQN